MIKEPRETYFEFCKKGLELVPFISRITVNFRVRLKTKCLKLIDFKHSYKFQL